MCPTYLFTKWFHWKYFQATNQSTIEWLVSHSHVNQPTAVIGHPNEVLAKCVQRFIKTILKIHMSKHVSIGSIQLHNMPHVPNTYVGHASSNVFTGNMNIFKENILKTQVSDTCALMCDVRECSNLPQNALLSFCVTRPVNVFVMLRWEMFATKLLIITERNETYTPVHLQFNIIYIQGRRHDLKSERSRKKLREAQNCILAPPLFGWALP